MLDKNIFNEVPDVVHNAVLDTLNSLEKKDDIGDNAFFILSAEQQKRKKFRMPKAAVAFLVFFLVSGITVSAMGAVSLYRQRMEEMDEESLEEYYSIVDSGEITSTNRKYSSEEKERYAELNKAYENDGVFPEEEIACIVDAKEYSGEGIALDATSRTLYLPERELSDEELLEIIDFEHKMSYSVYAKNEGKLADKEDWELRMDELDDEEVDETYLTMYAGNSEVSGAYSRQLSDTENSRYRELLKSYENEGLFTTTELTVIQTSEEYTGTGVAICVDDSSFYLPESELTDDELLQIIEFEHKALYCINRISDEVNSGLRAGYPKAK